jgi:RNA-binding protein
MDDVSLTSAQRAYLRGLGQRLDDSLKLGREGASPAVVAELERLLRSHELVKVRFVNADRTDRAALCDAIATAVHAPCVGAVGHTALFYRRNDDPAQRRIQLPE